MNFPDVEDLLVGAGGSSTEYDVAIIGAGCIGATIARELSKYEHLSVVIIERESDVSQGASKANSGIVHGGYDAKGKWKGRFEREGNGMFGKICEELSVPFKRIGSLVLSFTERDDAEISKLLENGRKNGVQNLEVWDRERVLKEEPHISVGIRQALYCPSAGITNPYLFTIANCENALENGVELRLFTEVKSIVPRTNVYAMTLVDRETMREYEIRSKRIVNCAGIFADKFMPSHDFRIKPRRGEYILLAREQGHMTSRVLFQSPTDRWGKGVLVSPTVDGNLLLGPSASDTPERDNKNTTVQELAYVAWAARRSVPHLDTRMSIRSFSGIRAKSSTGDFVIDEKNGFVNCAGIDSPGLTSSPAIALVVISMLNLQQTLKADWKMTRRPYDWASAAKPKESLRPEHPDPERNIVCKCETVTESTIIESLRRGIPVKCTDSVKWRTRAGMGSCQGFRCQHVVRDIIARENNVNPETVPKAVIGQHETQRLGKNELGRL